MEKVFEDYFSELQADMVSICLEYIENRAENIYIYCSFEHNVVFSSFYFKINGSIFKKHKVNDGLTAGDIPFNVSIERQKATVTIINEDIRKLIKLCEKYSRIMPTQIKLVYDVKSNSLCADYQYEPLYSEDVENRAMDILEAWIQETMMGTSKN